MTRKVSKFLIILVLLFAVTWSLSLFMSDVARRSIAGFLYAVIPLLAVLTTEKGRIPFREYGLILKDIPYKKILTPAIITAVVYPVFIVGAYFLLDNVLNLNLSGGIANLTSKVDSFNGTILPSSPFVRFLILFGVAFVASILSGFTFMFLFALFGETAWRGFLEKELNITNRTHKTATIGLIWGLWMILPRALGYEPVNIYFFLNIITTLIFFVTCSFLCINVLRKTGSLFGPALMMGVINSVAQFSILMPITQKTLFIAGTRGLVAIAGVLILNYIICSKTSASPRKIAKTEAETL